MRRVELLGGPWCGVEIAVLNATGWLWIEGSPEQLNLPRAYQQPGRDRVLYRSSGRRRMLHCGYLYVACLDCGVVHSRCDDHGHRLKECTLCGASLNRTRV